MSVDFHAQRKAWSEIKHQLLEKYLSLFISKLASTRGVLYFVDGFAGEGRYGDGSEGSPLIAAKRAVAPTSPKHAGVLRCINVEEDSESFQNLEENTRPFKDKGLVQNLHGTFQEKLPEILKTTRGKMALFFIDPLGAKGVELQQIETIASRGRDTEVLVRFDDTRVKRLIVLMTNLRDKGYDEGAVKTAEKFQKLVTGLSDESGITAVLDKHPESRQVVVESYERLIKSKDLFRFSLGYPIRDPTTGGHHYFLIHFSNHPDAYIHMAQFMAAAERSRRQPSSSDMFGEQQLLLAVSKEVDKQIERANVDVVADALIEIFRAKNWLGCALQNRDIYAAVVDQFKWRFIRAEWEQALQKLADSGYVKMAGKKDNHETTIKKV